MCFWGVKCVNKKEKNTIKMDEANRREQNNFDPLFSREFHMCSGKSKNIFVQENKF